MSSRAPSLNRRRFLEYALATTALCDERWYAATAEAAPGASAPRTLVDNLNGPEGPTMLPDGRVAFISKPGLVIAITPDGETEALASDLGLIVGTVLGKHQERALYICRMDPSRLRRRPAGGDASNAPPGDSAPGGAILRLDLQSKTVTPLYTQWDGRPLVGPNKLVVDEWGDLWITDVFEGSLYWARTDGSDIRRVVWPLPGAHGITLSRDRRTVYVSSGDRLNAFSIIARGKLAMDGDSPRQKLLTTLDRTWRVDGIRTQENGHILMACWDAGFIELSAHGRLLSQTRLPGLAVSNFVFGGRMLRTIFATVSVAGEGAAAQTPTGKVMSLPWAQSGLSPI